MNEGKGSLEETPTWAVSILCLALFLLSFIIETVLHYLTEFLRRRKRKSLNKALEKFKTEMMIMGFISLLLTISEVPISKICVTKAVANSFLPCKDPLESKEPAVSSATQISGSNSNTTLSAEIEDKSYCDAKGVVSLISREGIMQLRIFIFVLAVFHILYCVLTMFLGSAKMRKWKAWEEETRTLEYQIANDPRRFQLARQTSFGRQHLKFKSDYPLLLWPVYFIRQFKGSVSKADYFTLRNGFIKANCAEGGNFNFQKFLVRAFDDDFEQVIGISFWIWIFSILFIFFSAHVFYNYYWLPFIPLVIVLVVGTKLVVIMTEMCLESYNETSVIRGTFLVKPNDDFFWFGRPNWILHLLQLILIQVCFVRQFKGSVSKADYFTLRNGFIKANCAEGGNFNFQKFLARAFDDDFEQVIGISFWIWIFSILFIFFSTHGFYNHYWLPFIPLVIVLVVGTKLVVIMTEMCLESYNETSVIRGTFLVKPNDDFFWFGQPNWLLHLLQLILIQNSFQLAFFTWTWYEYGLRSCFNREMEDIALRISMGVFVQFLCGYVTLPLYALVTQMGSGMKTAVFTDRVAKGLKQWRNIARHSLSKNRSTSSRHSFGSRTIDTTETSISDMQNSYLPKYDQLPPSAVMSSPSPEITEEAVQHNRTPTPDETSFSTPEINKEEAHPKIITRGTYDGEISFGSSWKELERGKDIGAITSIIEENPSDIITEFNQ